MKFQLTRNDIRPSYPNQPFGWVPDDMRDKVCARKVFQSGRWQDLVFWRTDVVFDHPAGYRMVQNGDAIPMDEECELAAGLKPEQLTVVQYNRERLAKGIAVEDWGAYDAGYMTGYRPDGSWEPGPNYAEYLRRKREEEIDEDEDE